MQIFFNETIWPYWQQVLGLFDTIDVGTHNVLSEGIDQLGTVLGNFLGDIGQGLLTFNNSAFRVTELLVAFLFIILSIYFMGKSWSYYQDVYDRHVPKRLRKKAESSYKRSGGGCLAFFEPSSSSCL